MKRKDRIRAVKQQKLARQIVSRSRIAARLSGLPLNPELERQMPQYNGFPYLVTRIVAALYHIILLPAELPEQELQMIARRQAQINDLETCLVLGERRCIFYFGDGTEMPTDRPPRGGSVVFGRLKLAANFTPSEELLNRFSELEAYRERQDNNLHIMGDLTKGGRKATSEELLHLSGLEENGRPKGLTRCGKCGFWKGECLDPNKCSFEGMMMIVHCLCENRNLCASCARPLADFKLNANYFEESDGLIMHVPGFCGLSHQCFNTENAQEL